MHNDDQENIKNWSFRHSLDLENIWCCNRVKSHRVDLINDQESLQREILFVEVMVRGTL